MFGYDRLSIIDPSKSGLYVDGDGVIHFDVVVAWAGLRDYKDLHPSHPWQVRDPSQLQAKSFLDSIDGLTLTLGHPEVQHNGRNIPAMLDADGRGVLPDGRSALIPHETVSVGALYGEPRFMEIDGSLVPVKRARVGNADIREAIQSGAIREFSLGFRYIPILNKSGETFDGQAFDVWQVWDRDDPRVSPAEILKLGYASNIDEATTIWKRLGGNHGALVPRGRAGADYGVLGVDATRRNIPFFEGVTTPAGHDDHVHSIELYRYNDKRAGGHTGPGPDGHRHVVDVEFDANLNFSATTSSRPIDSHTHRVAGRGSPNASGPRDTVDHQPPTRVDGNVEVYEHAGYTITYQRTSHSLTCSATPSHGTDAAIGINRDLPEPRTFKMIRNGDESGVSGTGYVIDGVLFGDGSVVVFWRTNTSSMGIYKTYEEFESIHITPHPTNLTEVIFDDAESAGHSFDALPANKPMKRIVINGFDGLPPLTDKDGTTLHKSLPPIATQSIDMEESVADQMSDVVAGLQNVITVLQARIDLLKKFLEESQAGEEKAEGALEAVQEEMTAMESAKDAALKDLEQLRQQAGPAIKKLRDELEQTAVTVAGADSLPADVKSGSDDDVRRWAVATRRNVGIDSISPARALGAFEAYAESTSKADADDEQGGSAMREAFSKSTVPKKSTSGSDSDTKAPLSLQERLNKLQAS